jgi:hypothetical protein
MKRKQCERIEWLNRKEAEITRIRLEHADFSVMSCSKCQNHFHLNSLLFKKRLFWMHRILRVSFALLLSFYMYALHFFLEKSRY